ncbi:MAG: alpha/beta fold hydrolase [Acidobacteria bacterium]|nr:alpha/beta fold hydrolase [Acidobacteriota bacterium]
MRRKHLRALGWWSLGWMGLVLGTVPAAGQDRPAVLETPGSSLASPGEKAQEDRASEEPAQAAPTPGPMDLFIAYSRTQLGLQGFHRQETEIRGEAFVWWEKGEGPPLVLIHGVGDQAGTWFQVASRLAGSYRVLLVDLPGHGESGPAGGPLAMTAVLEGFETWLAGPGRRKGEAPPILVGNSMGAWIALLIGRRHPEGVSRVVAVNGGGLVADTGGLSLLPRDREEARRLMAALRDPASPATPDAVLDDLVRRVPGGQVSRMLEAQGDLESHLLDGHLQEVSGPVDLLWGRSDRYLGEEYPRRLLNGLPRARLTYLERCGHLPQAECAQAFANELETILASEAPAPQKKGEVP